MQPGIASPQNLAFEHWFGLLKADVTLTTETICADHGRSLWYDSTASNVTLARNPAPFRNRIPAWTDLYRAGSSTGVGSVQVFYRYTHLIPQLT
ncbi:hypothetical protein SODG_004894 [Sodalis praecaptivus]